MKIKENTFLEIKMTSQKEKKQMLEYIVSKLNGSNQKIEPVTNAFGDLKADYIGVGDNGIVFLIDKTYAKDSFENLHKMALINGNNAAFVFYKDGETFFRNAAESQGFKKKYGLSLKDYSQGKIQRMIEFRPEEIFMQKQNKWLQYYQPNSDRLKECIVSYKFEPVNFNRSYLTMDKLRLKYPGKTDEEIRAILSHIPVHADSKRLFIWDEGSKVEDPGFLKIGDYEGNSYLLKRKIDIS